MTRGNCFRGKVQGGETGIVAKISARWGFIRCEGRPNVQTAGACPSFISIEHLGVLLLPPDRMLVHRRVMPQKYVTGTHLYTWMKRDSEGVNHSATRATGGKQPYILRLLSKQP